MLPPEIVITGPQTAKCLWCKSRFPADSRKKFCKDSCRLAHWKWQHPVADLNKKKLAARWRKEGLSIFRCRKCGRGEGIAVGTRKSSRDACHSCRARKWHGRPTLAVLRVQPRSADVLIYFLSQDLISERAQSRKAKP